MKKIPLITLLVFLLSTASVFAVSFDDAYTVKSWDSQITVQENAKYHVVETIETEFSDLDKHGIYRTLPVSGVLKRDDIKTGYKASVENVKVRDQYGSPMNFTLSDTKYAGEDCVEIKIGDKNKTVDEHMTYIIEYDYDMYGDRLENGDEIYLNVIGKSWPTDIEHMTFSVSFPKPVNVNNAGVRVDNRVIYPQDSERATNQYFTATEYSLNANLEDVIYGSAVSFRVLVPEDYFEDTDIGKENVAIETTKGFAKLIVQAFAAVFSVMMAILVKIKSRKDDNDIVAPIMVMPPTFKGKTLSAYDMAYIYNRGEVEEKSVMSMLFDLANEGYLTIAESQKRFGKGYIFQKTKSNPPDKYRDMFLSGMFEEDDTVTTKQLEKNSFYRTIDDIKDEIEKDYSSINLLEGLSKKRKKRNEYIAIAMSCFGGFCILAGLEFSLGWMFAVVGAICLISASIIFSANTTVGRYRPEYIEIAGQIKGFKRFLEYAEKPRLEELVEQYPTYFYDVLPYAYALGVTNKYAKNFEGIAMEPPSYYHGSNFNAVSFTSGLSSSMSSSSSGGGSFSGGGGGGGGGGGSW